MNCLEVDMGNTRIKWRYAENGDYVSSGALPLIDAKNFAQSLKVQSVGPDKIIVANVAGEASGNLLESSCRVCWNVTPIFVETQKKAYGVEVAYADVSKLGVDRWLAMLGCHQRHPGRGKVIISLGSAITVDVVDYKGVHAGGYIVPGLRLMRESLRVNTAQVQVDKLGLQKVDLGKNTAEAVEHGMLKMVIAFIEAVTAPFMVHQNSQWVVALTGGDAIAVASSLTIDYLHEPELVLDGLALISR